MIPRKDLVVLCAHLTCAAPNKFYKSLIHDKNNSSVFLSGKEIEKLIKMVVSLPVKLFSDLHGGITASILSSE